MGTQWGYYRALALAGLTPAELALKTGTDERYARQWLRESGRCGHVDWVPGGNA